MIARFNAFLEISRAFGNVDLSHSDAAHFRKHDGLSAEPEVLMRARRMSCVRVRWREMYVRSLSDVHMVGLCAR